MSNTLDESIEIRRLVTGILEQELKKWLHETLPGIVRQAVAKEIEKVITKNE